MKRHFIILTTLFLLSHLLSGCSKGTDDTTPGNQTNITSSGFSNAAFSTTHFNGSQSCSICHNGLTDGTGTNVSLETDWASTMMANSARDPLFRAKVASETIRNPNIKDAIEAKCSRCHTPMASVEAELSGQPVKLLPPGFLSPDHTLFDAAMDGVSCTLCHQIDNDADFGEVISFSGNYSISTDKRIFGPFPTPETMPMINSSGYTPVLSSHISSSDACSSCHNLSTDVVDATTNELTSAKFPEQSTYDEWENSSFGQIGTSTEKSCQDCHMPETDRVVVSTMGMGLSYRDNFSKHYFVGANTFMLDILNSNKDLLGIKANNFDEVIQRTKDLLQSSASLEVTNTANTSGELSFNVKVKNLSGHKLPSGYPARRAYLHVTVIDATNTTVFESGLMNDNGSIVGVDADTDATKYEAHHDIITTGDQVQVYESIMQNTNSEVTYTLLNGASYIKDNRLLPAGFDKNTVSSDISPGTASKADANFIAASDDVIYRFTPGGTGPYSVNVELNYQSTAYQYSQDLFKDIGKHAFIDTYKQVYDTAKIQKETIATLDFIIN